MPDPDPAPQNAQQLQQGVDVQSGQSNRVRVRYEQDPDGAPDCKFARWLPARTKHFWKRGIRLQERDTFAQVTIHTLVSPSTAEQYAQKGSAKDLKYLPHYVVGPGTVIQMAREKYHVNHSAGANDDGIGIEHQGRSNDPKHYPDEQYRASAKLTRDICTRRDIAIDRQHIRGHMEMPIPRGEKGHGDPGGYWDWDYYMQLCNDQDVNRIVLADNDLFCPAGDQWTVGSGWQRHDGTRNKEHLGPFPEHTYGSVFYDADPITGDDADDPAVFETRIEREGLYYFDAWWPTRTQNNSATRVTVYAGAFAKGGGTPEQSFWRLSSQLAQNGKAGRFWRTPALPSTPKWYRISNLELKIGDTVRVEVSRKSDKRGKVVADAFRLLLTTTRTT